MVELQLDFLPHLKRMEDLTKKPWLVSNIVGSYQSSYRGQGKEFEGFALYTADQDAKRIDWVASAKSDKLLMRTFVEERDLKCFVIMDCSDSMFFSSTKKLKCEYAAELANTLLFSIIATGDQVGLMMASDSVFVNLPPKADKAQYFRMLTKLSDNSNYGGQRNFMHALHDLLRARERGVLFIISDFLNLRKEEIDVLGLLSRSFDISAFVVRDKVEKYLPKDLNAVCIEDPKTKQTIIVNLKQVREEYQDYMEQDESQVKEALLENDIDSMIFYTHMPFEGKLMEYFAMQRKKWK
jgi:uncharacterized protein (DUF58 family)